MADCRDIIVRHSTVHITLNLRNSYERTKTDCITLDVECSGRLVVKWLSTIIKILFIENRRNQWTLFGYYWNKNIGNMPISCIVSYVARLTMNGTVFRDFSSFQTCLRHPECTSSRENRDTVFCHMRRAIDLVHYVVKDGIIHSDHVSDVRTGSGSNPSMSNRPKEVG